MLARWLVGLRQRFISGRAKSGLSSRSEVKVILVWGEDRGRGAYRGDGRRLRREGEGVSPFGGVVRRG